MISSRAIIVASALILAGVQFAHAQAVYPGNPGSAHAAASPACTAPPVRPAAGSKIWYVDPVHGITPAAGGNGSQKFPWSSLQGVLGQQWVNAPGQFPGYIRPLLSSQPYRHNGVIVADNIGNPPVHPGDTILLASGNYGDVKIGGGPFPMSNSDWIRVQPVPVAGTVPVFNSLHIATANKWWFNGIKVTGVDTAVRVTPLVQIADGGPTLPTDSIVLTNMQISTVDDATRWTQEQWLAQGRIGIDEVGHPGNGTNGYPTLTCVSVTNSKIKNVAYAAILGANQSLFANNDLGYFFNDGIDFFGNGITITKNYEHDNFETEDGIHTDAMQGQNGPLGANSINHFSNILIDSNLIIRDVDVKAPFKTYLQGIVAFDEDWTHMAITNNVIVTSSCYSIAVSSIHDSLIANNTGIEDGLVASPGCEAAIGGGGSTHEGPPSTNSRFTNNIAPFYTIGGLQDVNVTYDHNIAIEPNGQGIVHVEMKPNKSGVLVPTWVFGINVGTDQFGNVNSHTTSPAQEFLQFSPTTGNYNAMLKWTAQSLRIGAAPTGEMPQRVGAAPTGEMPTTDILGVTRTAPYAAGAYGSGANSFSGGS
jgi:hypothetical protein